MDVVLSERDERLSPIVDALSHLPDRVPVEEVRDVGLLVIIVGVPPRPTTQPEGISEAVSDQKADASSRELGYDVRDDSGRVDERVTLGEQLVQPDAEAPTRGAKRLDDAPRVVVVGRERLRPMNPVLANDDDIGMRATDIDADVRTTGVGAGHALRSRRRMRYRAGVPWSLTGMRRQFRLTWVPPCGYRSRCLRRCDVGFGGRRGRGGYGCLGMR